MGDLFDFYDALGTVAEAASEFAEEAGLPPIADRDPSGRRGRYRLFDSHLLDPLREAGYVSVRESGRYKRVTATEAGENTLRAFGYLADEHGYREPSRG